MSEILLFIRPAVVALVCLCLLLECLLFYAQYKSNLFPDNVAKALESINIFNLKGLKKLLFDIGGRLIVVWFIVTGMYGIGFITGTSGAAHDHFLVLVGLFYCAWVTYFTYKVFRPRFKQAQT